MSATYKIRKFLVTQPDDEMFTTAQLLAFGTRAAVDQALCRMVSRGVIQRIARGLFVISIDKANVVTVMEAAQKKARAFGHAVMEHALDLAHRLEIMHEPNLTPTLATTGSSSSFLFKETTRIRYKRESAKKRQLAGSIMGDIIRSLWYLSKRHCDRTVLMRAVQRVGRTDRQQLRALSGLMPTWLHNYFVWR